MLWFTSPVYSHFSGGTALPWQRLFVIRKDFKQEKPLHTIAPLYFQGGEENMHHCLLELKFLNTGTTFCTLSCSSPRHHLFLQY